MIPTTRRVRAGHPVSEGPASAQQLLRSAQLHQADTEQLPDNRTVHVWGEPSEEEIAQANEAETGMEMLTYLLIALAVTSSRSRLPL